MLAAMVTGAGEGGRRCDTEGCLDVAVRGGHCWRHAKQILRHGMTREDALAQLLDANSKMGQCDTDEAGDVEFDRQLSRFKAALVCLAGKHRLPVTFLSLGKRRIRRQ